MLQSVGSQRVGHDLATEQQCDYLNLNELTLNAIEIHFLSPTRHVSCAL